MIYRNSKNAYTLLYKELMLLFYQDLLTIHDVQSVLGRQHLTALQVVPFTICRFTIGSFTIDARNIPACTNIDADVADGDVGSRVRTCKGKLVFAPIVGNVERQRCRTSGLYGAARPH